MAKGGHDEFFGTDSGSDYEGEDRVDNKLSQGSQKVESLEKVEADIKPYIEDGDENLGDHNLGLAGEAQSSQKTRESIPEGLHSAEGTLNLLAGGVQGVAVEESPDPISVPDFRGRRNSSETSCSKKVILIRFPNFLGIEYEEFDKDTWPTERYKCEIEAASAITETPHAKIENTIRWRYRKDGNSETNGAICDTIGNEPRKESNSKLVMWSDGNYSILVGSQIFDTTISSTISNQCVAVGSQSDTETMRIENYVTGVMAPRLYLSQKDTEHLKDLMVSRHVKRAKTKGFFFLQDPEKYAGRIEKLEMEKMEARKRLKAKRLAAQKRYNRGDYRKDASAGDSDGSMYGSHSDDYETDGRERIRPDSAKKKINADQASVEKLIRSKYAAVDVPNSPGNDIADRDDDDTHDQSNSDGSDGLITQSSRKRRAVIYHDEIE